MLANATITGTDVAAVLLREVSKNVRLSPLVMVFRILVVRTLRVLVNRVGILTGDGCGDGRRQASINEWLSSSSR